MISSPRNSINFKNPKESEKKYLWTKIKREQQFPKYKFSDLAPSEMALFYDYKHHELKKLQWRDLTKLTRY